MVQWKKKSTFHYTINVLKIFKANDDGDSVVKYDLIPPITTRSMRIIPYDWHVLIALRVELYGCQASKKL